MQKQLHVYQDAIVTVEHLEDGKPMTCGILKIPPGNSDTRK